MQGGSWQRALQANFSARGPCARGRHSALSRTGAPPLLWCSGMWELQAQCVGACACAPNPRPKRSEGRARGTRTGEAGEERCEHYDMSNESHAPLAAACCAACSAAVYSPKRWPTRACAPDDMQTRELSARGARRVSCALCEVCGVQRAHVHVQLGAAPHRMLHVLLGARVHTRLLRASENFAAEGDYALAKAPLHQPVEHA